MEIRVRRDLTLDEIIAICRRYAKDEGVRKVGFAEVVVVDLFDDRFRDRVKN